MADSRTRTTKKAPARGDAERRRWAAALIVGDAAALGSPATPRAVFFEASLLVGRKPGAPEDGGQVLLLRDPLISSRHAAIRRAGRDYEVSDLGSTNGTSVNLVPVEGATRIDGGGLIFVGNHALVFRRVSDEERRAIEDELRAPFAPVGTASPRLALITDRLRRLARGPGELLFVGETGSGKEVYAEATHRASGRGGRFLAVNCAAIPRELVETELFGYVRGAHSQAREGKQGLIEMAEGGTLFLDEIGDMSSDLQAKLLRFLQDRLLRPVGSVRERRIDTRIIAATHRRPLGPLAAEGLGLRADLAARLGSEPIELPPLRDRIEDLGALVGSVLSAPRAFDADALQALCSHRWPGNVRELRKIVEDAVLLARDGEPIARRHLPQALRGVGTPTPAIVAGNSPGRGRLEELLATHEGNVRQVARVLGAHPTQVYRWIKRASIDPAAFRPSGQGDNTPGV